jgi:hypothetical protein
MAKAKEAGSSLVKYGGWSTEEAAEQKAEAAASSGSGTFYKLKVGKNVLRFVPPRKGEKMIAVAFVHYVDVPGAGRTQFNCPRVMAKRKCPVCEMQQKLANSNSDADQKKAKKLFAKRRCFANVIVRGSEADGPKVLGFGKMIEDALIEMREDEDEGGDFVHPVNGFDVLIKRKGETEYDTEYHTSPANKGKTCPLAEDADQMDEWISNQKNLTQYLAVLEDDEIDEKLSGGSSRDRGRGNDRGRPAARTETKPAATAPAKRGARRLDDEIEDAEVDED